jgi:uncharacterized membrane protein YdjX (TVP38/TMEM64 family)
MTEPTPYTAPAAGPARPTNTLAIIALIAAFVFPLAGIVIGHIALSQIKKTGEGGHALALWGTILGYVFTVVYLLIIVLSFVIPLLILGTVGNTGIPSY